jgi:hypothetical protein
MAEDGAMERGRLDGVSPYHLPANRFLVGRCSAEALSVAFSPLQYSNTPSLSGAL